MEEDPEAQARVADVRGDRRRADGRGDGRPDRRALTTLAEAQLPPHRSGQRAGAAVRRRRGAAGQLRRQAVRESGERDRTHGRRAAHAQPRDRRQTRRDRRPGPGRRAARRLPHEGLGGGRAGLAAGRDAGAGDRRGDRPGRARRSAPGLHAAGPSRGVRGRRHDGAERPPGRRRGGDAVGNPRRAHDQAPASTATRHEAVRLPRPRQHGDDLALSRDRQLQGHQGRRVRRLADVGVRPPHVPDRLQEPLDRAAEVAERVRRQVAATSARSRCSRSPRGSSRMQAGVEAGRGRPVPLSWRSRARASGD